MAEQKQRSGSADPERTRSLFSSGRLVLRLMGDRRVPAILKVLPLVVLAYVLSPVDLLPALAMGPLAPLGTLDDIGVILLGLTTFIQLAPADVVDEYRRKLSGAGDWKVEDAPGAPGGAGSAADQSPPVVDGTYRVADDD